jgi:hypothetical protein
MKAANTHVPETNMPTTKAKKTTAKAAKKSNPKKPAKAQSQPAAKKKLSALDAAAQILAENGGSMSTKELIEAMAAKKLWVSPNGKTPAATLYAALLREINTKGANSRFQKIAPGQFAALSTRTPNAEKAARKGGKNTRNKTGTAAEQAAGAPEVLDAGSVTVPAA